jgi:hypothetical protein
MADRRYLESHGNQWRVQVKVPSSLRRYLGAARLVVPLHTDSLVNANRLKFCVIADLQDKIARARAEAALTPELPDAQLTNEALEWKADIQREPQSETPIALRARLDEVERSAGREKAAYFEAVATGGATPIMSLVDTWLAERDMKPRQRIDYARAVRKFNGWVIGTGLNGAIEEVTRKVAGRYVSEALVARKVHWKTANKDITALSGYWKWLMRRGHVEYNVWPSAIQLRTPRGPNCSRNVLPLASFMSPG